MKGFSSAKSTASSRKYQERNRAPSPAAWERVSDRLRLRSSAKSNSSAERGPEDRAKSLSRTDLFEKAGLRHQKMLWMRRQPDLRMSVIVVLARALNVKPGAFLEAILEEEGHPKYDPPPPRRPTPSELKKKRLKMARTVAG